MDEPAAKGGRLAKKDLRLQFSGFLIFATKLISVATGLIFQLIIARSTTKTEYDIWFNTYDTVLWFTLLAGVVPFWTMRFVVREKEGAVKTGILSNLAISIVATLVYLPLVSFITSGLGVGSEYVPLYFLMAIQIIELHALTILEACLQARIPKKIGYGLLIQQIFKVILGYFLIMSFQQPFSSHMKLQSDYVSNLGGYLLAMKPYQPLLWAVIATLVAFVVQIAYYFTLVKDDMKFKVQWDYVKEWLKGSVANIISVAGNQLATTIFFLLFMYGGEGARGRFGAATQIANIITYSSFLAFALYPKLLAEKKNEDVTMSLKTVLMFAIPMTAGAVVLSSSYISILREEFADASLILIVLAIDAFVAVISGVFSTVVFGMETVDENEKITFRRLAKSRLFIAFILPYFHAMITIPTTFYVLTTYALNQPLQAALYVSIINFVARFVMFLVLLSIVHKMTKINIPWRSTAKYVLAAGTMSIFLLLVPHTTRLSITLVTTALGGIIYLAILLAIDKEVRALPKTILQEIRKGE
jgi:O-antigen/teichoic acid export membrane protein